MLSHELRNPLNVIAGGVAVHDAFGRADDQAAHTRQLIVRQVQHLTNLMDDLLDIARVTSGKIVLNRRPLELSATVERCLAALGETRKGQHAWRSTLQPVWIDADETRIEQIVANLLGNAMKFTPAGGEISVTVSADDCDAVVWVRDSGVGIVPELLPRVFDLFVQGDRSPERAQGGLGLGLTLVRRLVEMHGGTVDAVSDGAGHGATFIVR